MIDDSNLSFPYNIFHCYNCIKTNIQYLLKKLTYILYILIPHNDSYILKIITEIDVAQIYKKLNDNLNYINNTNKVDYNIFVQKYIIVKQIFKS
jgi:hypothetical protein